MCAPASMQLTGKCLQTSVLSQELVPVLLQSANRGRWRQFLNFSRSHVNHLCRIFREKTKNLSFISRHTTTFQSADSLLVDQSLQFNWNTARFRVFDVAIRRDNAGSVCFWGKEKYVYFCPFFKRIFGFLFRTCLFFSHVYFGHQHFTSYLYLLEATV